MNANILVCRLEFYQRDLATNCVASKHWPMKLKSQLAGDEVHIATDLCRQRCRQQPMHHQAALLVRFEVVHALITRESREKPDVFLGKSSFPDTDIANFH